MTTPDEGLRKAAKRVLYETGRISEGLRQAEDRVFDDLLHRAIRIARLARRIGHEHGLDVTSPNDGPQSFTGNREGDLTHSFLIGAAVGALLVVGSDEVGKLRSLLASQLHSANDAA